MKVASRNTSPTTPIATPRNGGRGTSAPERLRPTVPHMSASAVARLSSRRLLALARRLTEEGNRGPLPPARMEVYHAVVAVAGRRLAAHRPGVSA